MRWVTFRMLAVMQISSPLPSLPTYSVVILSRHRTRIACQANSILTWIVWRLSAQQTMMLMVKDSSTSTASSRACKELECLIRIPPRPTNRQAMLLLVQRFARTLSERCPGLPHGCSHQISSPIILVSMIQRTTRRSGPLSYAIKCLPKCDRMKLLRRSNH